jgi:anti-sigma-K factor RskA
MADLHILAGAYALDALDDGAELDRFTRHLRRCATCTAEVRGLREVATSLAFAVAAEPPAGLKARVMAAIAVTRQLPPEIARERWRWLRYWLTGPRLTGQWLAGRWMPRLAVVTAAVAVAVAVVLGVVTANTSGQLNQARAQARQIAAVLAAPDARIVSGPVSTGGTATVELSASRRQLVVTTAGLAPLPDGKVYQLWLIGPPATRSAGLLPAAVSGRAGPVLASGLTAGDQLAMTVEPAGGTSQPTTNPVLAITLPAD